MKKSDWIVVLTALIISLVMLFTPEKSVETGSWGLNFSEKGVPPMGPVDHKALAEYDAAYIGDTDEPVIYLTFDAGYENGYTAKILDVLKAHDAPAAFFLVGNYIEKNPDLVRRMVAEGHTVGNHTMTHPDMSRIKDMEDFAEELEELAELYEETVGAPMAKFYRPPQGIYSKTNLEQAKELGYKTVFWSLAYADWDNNNQPDPTASVEKLTGRLHNGAVVLLHSTSKTNGEILDTLLTKWEKMGYRFAPIEELFESSM